MASLRQRAVAGGIAWATTVTFAGSYILGTYLDQQAQSRFDDLLVARHNQAVVALANSAGDQEGMSAQLRDPIYLRSFSGDYWQAQNSAEDIAVSRSLADALLPDVQGIATELTLHTVLGPANQTLRQAVQRVLLDDAGTASENEHDLRADRAFGHNRDDLADGVHPAPARAIA